MKILFLSANPDGTTRLHLDEEVNKIDDCLRKSKLRDQFQFITKLAVDASTLRQALLEEDPDIIHFSGHGEGQAGLVLVGQDNKPKPATADALSSLFKLFPKIKCVLLNACYAEEQAKAIVQHVAYVVGMKQAVRDDAAIAFAAGFYDGLGYGKPIDMAFELGRNAIQFELASFSDTTRKLIPVDLEKVEPLPDHLIPVLLKKEAGSTGNLMSLTPSSSEANSLAAKLQKDDISEAEALRVYRTRVQEFLVDRKLTQLEKAQLAILAKVLGLSEVDANRILQEEQDEQQDSAPTITRQPRSKRIGTPKNIFVCVVLLFMFAGGFSIYKIMTPPLREKYEFKDGTNSFVHVSNKVWKEEGTDGKEFNTFKEIKRDSDYITIYDVSRDMTIKIPIEGGNILMTLKRNNWVNFPYRYVIKKSDKLDRQ